MINVTPDSSIRVLGTNKEYKVADLLSALEERDEAWWKEGEERL